MSISEYRRFFSCFKSTPYLFFYLRCTRLLKLALIQICIKSAQCDQFIMRALFDDIAVLHDKDQVRIFDR